MRGKLQYRDHSLMVRGEERRGEDVMLDKHSTMKTGQGGGRLGMEVPKHSQFGIHFCETFVSM